MAKIVQINVCANWGSTGRIAEQINNTLSEEGWDTYFAYGRSVNPSRSKLIHIGNKLSQVLALVEARLFDNDGLASYIATKSFVKRLKQIKPDIIHIHNLHGYYINYKVLFNYLNSTDIPVVWTLHDCWSFTGHCGHFITAGCEKWKKGCCKCPLKKDYPTSFFLDRSSRNYELKKKLFTENKNLHIVVVSEWLKGLVEQSFLACHDITVINNGIDTNVFKPDTLFSNSSRFRILGVSSVWTAKKGFEDFKRLREALDKDKYEIIMVGLSNEQKHELPDGIIGVERTNSVADLASYYSSADVFLNFTSEDTFPTTNIEALACGTPVITYKTGGAPEILSPETGYVIETGNIEKAIECIEIIRRRGKKSFSEACRSRAGKNYEKRDKYKEYLRKYLEITKINGGYN